jgi:3-oxoacyl-(acyl-carrier-protein) synthase
MNSPLLTTEMSDELERRIAVTGMGMVGSFGVGIDALWQTLENGGVTFAPCSRYTTVLPSAEAHAPDLRRLLRTATAARAPLVSQFALAATHFALLQAGIKLGTQIASENIALVYGTSNGPGAATQEIYEDLLNAGSAAVKPRVFQESVFNAPASLTSIQFGIKGPIIVLPAGIAAGAHVLLQAQILLAQEDVHAVIALCADELCEGVQSGARMVRYHCGPLTNTSCGAHPYDLRNQGPVMAEGACALVLERADRASARGAEILAELAGVACGNDAYRLAHNAPDGRGLSAAIHACLQDAEASASKVGAVISGAVTRADEIVEQAALLSVFAGEPPPVSSVKGGIGLAMGASALLDAALSIESLRRRTIPPTPRHEVPTQGLTLDIVTQSRVIPQLDAILSTSIGVNGLYGAALFRRMD